MIIIALYVNVWCVCANIEIFSAWSNYNRKLWKSGETPATNSIFFATFVHLCIFSCLFWALNGSFNIMCVVFHVLFLHQTLYTPSWSRQRLWPGRSKLVHDVGVYKWIVLKKKIVLALDFCILHICSTEIWLLAPGKTVQMNHTHVSATINHCLLIEFQYISCK